MGSCHRGRSTTDLRRPHQSVPCGENICHTTINIDEPEELPEAYLSKLGLTQKRLGHTINMAPRTVRMCAENDGKHPVNPIAQCVDEWVDLGFIPEEWPKKMTFDKDET